MNFAALNLKLGGLNLSAFKFPSIFANKAKPSAGLVIRPGVVELVSMRGRGVASRVRVPIELGAEGALTRAINQAVDSAGLKTRRLAVSIQSPDILIRFFSLPMIPKSEWEAAAQFEARKYVPFKMENLVWDCSVMPTSAAEGASPMGSGNDGERLEVVFTAIPREAFSQYRAALEGAGVQPTVVEPFSLSLARLASQATTQGPQEFVCLVDLDPSRAHLVIARGGVPYLTRDVNLSTGREELPPDDASGVAIQQSPQLLSELSVSIDFFTREYPAARIAKVVLLGDEPLISSWSQWLTGQLSCEIDQGTTLLANHVQGDLPLSYAAVIGLLEAPAVRGTTTIDFLRREQVKTGTPPPQQSINLNLNLNALVATLKRPQTLVAGLAGLSLPIAIMTVLATQRVQQARLSQEQAVRTRMPVGLGLDGLDQPTLLPVQEQAAQRLALLKQLVDERVNVAAKLDALARALPEGVWITTFTYSDALDFTNGKSKPRLSVDGACYLGASGKEFAAIQAFQEQIKRDPRLFKGFDVAQLGQINATTDSQRQATYRTFQLECHAEKL